jgi:PII-like signaling protein
LPKRSAITSPAAGQHESSHGATVLRGIWGFHGDHPPHGDKLFQLSRQVPVVTIIIDTPATSRHRSISSMNPPANKVW